MRPDLSHIPGYLPPYTGTLSEPPTTDKVIGTPPNTLVSDGVARFPVKYNDLGYPEPNDTDTAITLPPVVIAPTPAGYQADPPYRPIEPKGSFKVTIGKTPHKCPVCDGAGNLKIESCAGRLVPVGCQSADALSYPCRACDGKGVLWG